MGKLGRAGQTYNGKKKGSKDGVEGLSKELLLVRGVPVKIVGHEENVGSRWDEGMARFHNLKAQETEGTHQFSWKSKAGKEDVDRLTTVVDANRRDAVAVVVKGGSFVEDPTTDDKSNP